MVVSDSRMSDLRTVLQWMRAEKLIRLHRTVGSQARVWVTATGDRPEIVIDVTNQSMKVRSGLNFTFVGNGKVTNAANNKSNPTADPHVLETLLNGLVAIA